MSFYDALDQISYADGLRLINQWWLDADGGGKLRAVQKRETMNVAGLFDA